MLKNLPFLIVLLFSFSGFSQEERMEPLSRGGGRVIIRPSEGSSTTSETVPTPPSSEDEAVVDEIIEERNKQNKDIESLEAQTTEMLGEYKKNPQNELEALGYKSLTLKALGDDKVLAMLQKQLAESQMDRISQEGAKELLLARVSGTFWETVFKKFPTIHNIAAEIFRDKNALTGLLNIAIRKADLKSYGYILCVIFVFSLFFKNRIVKPKWNFTKRFTWSFTLNIVLMLVSFSIFYSFFKVEITPTLNIISKHLF